ncbi:tetratricopeptide repeat protein [Kribbella sp. C-35]|uniref:AfsR/SARP family transcriptional regulator n=1 Tax=Kribbella sp. C-35 TaxID=2789276 RepID=UPI00397951FF
MESVLRFGLLGPLRVDGPEGEIAVQAGKHRIVLATLLLQANKTVSIEQLTDRLWSETPVKTARATVHQYVMRLRQRLGEPDLIRTVPGAYLIELPDERIDLHEFDGLVRRAHAAGDPAAESRLLHQATKLWRGTPLADVPSDSLQQTEAPRLSERYLQAVERRIDVDLLLAREHDLIAELRTLTVENPLRERFWFQLIAALYRTGRQAEALDAYQAVHRLMDEELGIAPGQQLRDLHEAIIKGGAVELGVGVSRPAVTVVEGPVPQQLPPIDNRFVGRSAEIDGLVAALGRRPSVPSPVVVAVHGPGGLGKSTLAIRAAHAVGERFPDGHLYIDLQGTSPGLEPLAAGDALNRFLRAIVGPDAALPTTEDELAARFRTEVSNRRMLLLLDNAANERQLAPLLPAGPGCAVLITSRQPVAGIPATAVRATPLSTPEAVDLLSHIMGADRVVGEYDAVLELIHDCGHNPLALRIIGARLAGIPELTIRHTVRRLQAGHWRDLGVEENSVRSSLEVSYVDLIERTTQQDADRNLTAEGFRMIGLLQTPEVTASVLGALLDVPAPDSASTLEQLAELHLIEAAGNPDRYRMHDLLRMYSRDLARQHDSHEDRELALKRAYEWYVSAVAEVSRAINGNRWDGPGTADSVLGLSSRLDATAWLDLELPNLTALARQPADAFRDPLCRLVPMIAHTLQKRGRWREIESLIRLALPAAAQIGDQKAEATMLANLSACDWRAGRFDEAEDDLQRSYELRKALGDPISVGRALHNLGWFYQRTGSLPKAIEYYERSLELVDSSAEPVWTGTVLHNLGEALYEAGDYAEAEACLERCLEIRRQCNDASGAGMTLAAVGRVYAHRGKYGPALTALGAGIEICRDIGNREDEWGALLVRAEILLRTGEPAAAESSVTQALAITRVLGNEYGDAAGTRLLARILAGLDRPTESAAAQARSLELFEQLSAPTDAMLEEFLTATPTATA